MLILLGMGSCGKRTVQLDRDLRKAIDTLAAKQINILRPELDSLCDLRFDSMVAASVDSIMQVRQSERTSIIGK